MTKIVVGGWRDDTSDPMQVVSAPMGREKVHYRAPDARRISEEMLAFLNWFNGSKSTDAVLKAS
jgi:Fic family protein